MTTTTQAYGAYGERADTAGAARTAYAGEVPEAGVGWYLLGERAYSPTLRRFIAPDRTSPFAGGGVNRYAYCGGDPINRIDPSGRTWLDWLGACVGLAANAGAMRPVSQGSPDMPVNASTPDTVVATAAAMTDATSITSAIDSVALMTANNQNAGGLFGWVAMGTKVASGGSSLPPARKRPPPAPIPTPAIPTRTVQVVTEPDIPAHRLMTNEFGWQALTKNWIRRSHSANPASKIWATDTRISGDDVENLLPTMNNLGITDVNLYTGAHGSASGANWDKQTDARRKPHRTFFLEDLDIAEQAARKEGMNITVVNMGTLTRHNMQQRLSQDGDHVIGTCYGIADDVVMESLNLPRVTVYKLLQPRP